MRLETSSRRRVDVDLVQFCTNIDDIGDQQGSNFSQDGGVRELERAQTFVRVQRKSVSNTLSITASFPFPKLATFDDSSSC